MCGFYCAINRSEFSCFLITINGSSDYCVGTVVTIMSTFVLKFVLANNTTMGSISLCKAKYHNGSLLFREV